MGQLQHQTAYSFDWIKGDSFLCDVCMLWKDKCLKMHFGTIGDVTSGFKAILSWHTIYASALHHHTGSFPKTLE